MPVDLQELFGAIPWNKRHHGAYRALLAMERSGESVIHLDMDCPITVDIENPDPEFYRPVATLFAITDRRFVAFGPDHFPSGVLGVTSPSGHIVLEIQRGDVAGLSTVDVPQLDAVNIHVLQEGRDGSRRRTHSLEWFVLERERLVLRLLQELM